MTAWGNWSTLRGGPSLHVALPDARCRCSDAVAAASAASFGGQVAGLWPGWRAWARAADDSPGVRAPSCSITCLSQASSADNISLCAILNSHAGGWGRGGSRQVGIFRGGEGSSRRRRLLIATEMQCPEALWLFTGLQSLSSDAGSPAIRANTGQLPQ